MSRALVTGGSGFIGGHVCRALAGSGRRVFGTFGRNEELVPADGHRIAALPLDLTDDSSITAALNEARPDVVVHCAAMSALKDCEKRPKIAMRINSEATDLLARWCLAHRARLIYFSTDQVFDGKRGGYCEEDRPNPIHVYGRTKAEAERRVLARGAKATILRISLTYGRSGPAPAPGPRKRAHNEQVLLAARRNERLRFFADEFRSPILVDDVASAVSELADLDGVGILHLAGPDRVSRVDFGSAILASHGLGHVTFDAMPLADANTYPQRPPDLSLDTARARGLLSRAPRGIQEGLELLVSGGGGRA